jgi:hypothetical protein
MPGNIPRSNVPKGRQFSSVSKDIIKFPAKFSANFAFAFFSRETIV